MNIFIKISFLTITSLCVSVYSSCFLVFAQPEYKLLANSKPVVDYYDKMDDKSFYQQKRIYGMKGELNNYSEKLHDLQERFDQIFYGLSAQGNFKTPFDVSNQPRRPVIEKKLTVDSKVTRSVTDDPVVIDDSIEPVKNENQLAFKVNSPGTFTKDNEVVSTFIPRDRSNGPGFYLFLSPGIAFPHKIHKNPISYKRYDPGFSTNISGGITINGFKVGVGGIYKFNSFHKTSKFHTPLINLTGQSETFAGYLDIGYDLNVFSSLDAYLGLGVGYYLSLIDDKRNLSARQEHDIFLTASTGLKWRFNQIVALSLGYRYFYEKEVPAHLGEFGLNFEF